MSPPLQRQNSHRTGTRRWSDRAVPGRPPAAGPPRTLVPAGRPSGSAAEAHDRRGRRAGRWCRRGCARVRGPPRRGGCRQIWNPTREHASGRSGRKSGRPRGDRFNSHPSHARLHADFTRWPRWLHHQPQHPRADGPRTRHPNVGRHDPHAGVAPLHSVRPNRQSRLCQLLRRHRRQSQVAVVNTQTYTVPAVIPVDEQPYALAVAPDRRELWVPAIPPVRSTS